MSEVEVIQVAIVDYGMGNLFSVKHACERVGLTAHITSSSRGLMAAQAAILPGVGAFGDAMDALKTLDLVSALVDFVHSGKPFVGICLGMQLLMEESEEFGRHGGLGVVGGDVVRLREDPRRPLRVKVPQVAWNRIHPPYQAAQSGAGMVSPTAWKGTLLDGLADGEFMYFVHSFYPRPSDPALILSTTRHGSVEFCSSFRVGNVFACQFHPERSGPRGLQIYQNLSQLIEDALGTRRQ